MTRQLAQPPPADPQFADAWERQVLAYDTDADAPQLLDALAANRDGAIGLLDRLANVRNPIIRAWAGTAASAVFGRDAIPLLTQLTKDRDPDVRDVARQDLVALDPSFEQTFFPAYRRALKRRKDKWGEDREAMWALARAKDREAVALLRDYASHYDPRHYHNRMPLVLADYIEDPSSVVRRIRDHDHDFMFWLVNALAYLEFPEAQQVLTEALAEPFDNACVDIIRERLRYLSERPTVT